jgi:hypothetical protein
LLRLFCAVWRFGGFLAFIQLTDYFGPLHAIAGTLDKPHMLRNMPQVTIATMGEAPSISHPRALPFFPVPDGKDSPCHFVPMNNRDLRGCER